MTSFFFLMHKRPSKLAISPPRTNLLFWLNSYGEIWSRGDTMSYCFEGIKQLGASLSKCCERQSTGLEDPEILARETVCMLSVHISLYIYPLFVEHWWNHGGWSKSDFICFGVCLIQRLPHRENIIFILKIITIVTFPIFTICYVLVLFQCLAMRMLSKA